MTSGDERQTRSYVLNADYTAAWCGDRNAFDRLCAAKDDPLAKAFLSLLLLFTSQYLDEKNGVRLAADCIPWLLQKEQQDNPHAHFVFAVLQHTGVAMAQDVSSAVVTLLRLSHQGHANAQCVLARHYADTTNSLLNPEVQSLRWYTSAAAQDHPEALYRLGRHHLSHPDHDTDKDKVTGATYLSRAAARGHPAALQHLGDCHRHAVGVARDEDRAFLEYKESSEKNDLYATALLAECYAMDVGGQKDDNKSARLYKKAAEEGHIGACYHAGMNHFNGTFEMERDDGLASQYFRRFIASTEVEYASEEVQVKVARAKYVLGLQALHGLDRCASAKSAAEFFDDSSNQGYVLARIELAVHLAITVATTKSKAKAQLLLDDVIERLGNDIPLAMLSPHLYAGQYQPHTAVHLRCLTYDSALGYACWSHDHPLNADSNDGLKNCAFLADDEWLQEAAPLLKVGLLFLALHPADPHEYTSTELRSSLSLLYTPLRRAGRTVTCVCEAGEAIEIACNAVENSENFAHI